MLNFIAFQGEQAELNRQHKLKMLEINMNHSHLASQRQPPQLSPLHVPPQVQPTQPYNPVPYSQTGIQNIQEGGRQENILNLDSQNNQSSMRWFLGAELLSSNSLVDGLHLTSWRPCWSYNAKEYIISSVVGSSRRGWLTLCATF